MKIILVITSLLFIMIQASSQFTEEWVKRYNGPANLDDEVRKSVVDPAGNVYVTGRSRRTATDWDMATVKYNSSGVELWSKRYNGPSGGDDEGNTIAVDASGNVYVAGKRNSSTSLDDFITIKYSPLGDSLWAKAFNGNANGNDFVNSLAIDNSGNVYVSGSSNSPVNATDYVTIKYNPGGDSLWVRRYNGPANSVDDPSGLVVDNSGNVYVCGRSYGVTSQFDYGVVKYTPSGTEEWVRRYNGTANNLDEASAIVIDNQGNICVTGKSYSSNNYDYATIRYSPSGNQDWVARFDGFTSVDEAYSIAADNNGGVIVTGRSYSAPTSYDFATVKYNPAGQEQWNMRYNGLQNGQDEAKGLALDTAGNIYVTGRGYFASTGYDFVTIKYNSAGTEQWRAVYNSLSSVTDEPSSIVVDAAGNVYVSGISAGGGAGEDFTTVKYSQPIGIIQISGNVPEGYFLEQNFPNPFNPVTKINFALPKYGFASLKIYGVLGNEVSVIAEGEFTAGTYSAEWNAENFSSGLYFCVLKAGEYRLTRKMILVK